MAPFCLVTTLPLPTVYLLERYRSNNKIGLAADVLVSNRERKASTRNVRGQSKDGLSIIAGRDDVNVPEALGVPIAGSEGHANEGLAMAVVVNDQVELGYRLIICTP